MENLRTLGAEEIESKYLEQNLSHLLVSAEYQYSDKRRIKWVFNQFLLYNHKCSDRENDERKEACT